MERSFGEMAGKENAEKRAALQEDWKFAIAYAFWAV
jgi:hypothetical protein